jgi:hypothetical protein
MTENVIDDAAPVIDDAGTRRGQLQPMAKTQTDSVYRIVDVVGCFGDLVKKQLVRWFEVSAEALIRQMRARWQMAEALDQKTLAHRKARSIIAPEIHYLCIRFLCPRGRSIASQL